MHKNSRFLLCELAVILGVCAHAGSSGSIDYPQGFRRWALVKTAVIGPQSPGFKANGGIHHVYANAKAVEGLDNGSYPEGSILVFELVEGIEKDGVTTEGARKRVDMMVKDSQRFSASGGWGFEQFRGDSQTDRPLTEEVRTQCFTCHQQRKSNDLVFSEYRK